MATTLSAEEMKQRVRRHFEDFVDRRRAEVIHENMTEDFLDHDGPGARPADRAGDEAMMREMYRRMPDLRVSVEDLVAEDDKVVCRNVWWFTDPDSGERRSFQGFVLWRFEGDRIAERWATVTSPAATGTWGAPS